MTRKKMALVLLGGGARGAYQVGVLKAVAARVPRGVQPFPIITGISVGALNASVIASRPDDFHDAVDALERIWRNLHCEHVFVTSSRAMIVQVLRTARSLVFGAGRKNAPKSILDNAPLRALVTREVDFAAINRAGAEGEAIEAVSITASAYENGTAVGFYRTHRKIKPWARARRVSMPSELTVDHVMASSALPFLFPSVAINGKWYGDGALRETAPISPAIHLGAEHIVTIGARDGTPDEPAVGVELPYPDVGELAGQLMDIVFNDNTESDIERLSRVNDTISMIPPEICLTSRLRRIGISSINPSQDVRAIAGEHAHSLPGTLRFMLRTMGAMQAPWVLPSYLMFEPGYVGALIDLGTADGHAYFEENPLPL